MNKKTFCRDSRERICMVIVEEKGRKLPTTMARRCLEKTYLDFTYIEF
jgi:hypothetical protein